MNSSSYGKSYSFLPTKIKGVTIHKSDLVAPNGELPTDLATAIENGSPVLGASLNRVRIALGLAGVEDDFNIHVGVMLPFTLPVSGESISELHFHLALPLGKLDFGRVRWRILTIKINPSENPNLMAMYRHGMPFVELIAILENNQARSTNGSNPTNMIPGFHPYRMNYPCGYGFPTPPGPR